MAKDDYFSGLGFLLALALIAPFAAATTAVPKRRGYMLPILGMGIAGFGGAAVYDHYHQPPKIERQYVAASQLEVLAEDRDKNGFKETYLKVNNETYAVKQYDGKTVFERK